MQTTLYSVTIPIFIKNLKNLSTFIDKGAIHAENKKFDAGNLLTSRLAPDQFPFMKQIQLASDAAKSFPARVMGVDPVSMPDTEMNLEDLKKRIDATVAILEAVKPEDIAGKEDTKITLKYFTGKHITAFDYATEYVLPNFFFHVVTAYAILRHNGIELGKSDYLGSLSLQDGE